MAANIEAKRPPEHADRSFAMSNQAGVIACLENITQRYGNAVALDDVAIAVPGGSLVGLIGPDGVGKSSLLAIIAGAREIQTGVAHVLDGDIADRVHRAAVCPRIAYMPQGLGKNLYPDLSIRENIEYFARLFGQSRVEREGRIAELLISTGSGVVCRAPGEETIGRHEAEARTLLRPDPQSRPVDPRRANDRRRPAVAAAILGTDRTDTRPYAQVSASSSRPRTWKKPSGSTGWLR